jgi:RNA polymerase sigma factor (sigma-70 family)
MPTLSGEEVAAALRAAAAGDEQAWNRLVEGFANLLWSVARAHRLDDAAAADAVQTAWLRLLENLDRITEPERLGAWLSTTVRRECLRIIRKSGREGVTGDESAFEVPDTQVPDLAAAMLTDERDAALWRIFEGLNDRCRRLLRVLISDPSPAYADVAEALDMPIGSIGPTRARCLDKLRAFLAGDAATADLLRGPA